MVWNGAALAGALGLRDSDASGLAGEPAGPADGGTEPLMRWRTRMLAGGSCLRTRRSSSDTVMFWHYGAPLFVLPATSGDDRCLAILGGTGEQHRQFTVAAGVWHTVWAGDGENALWSEASVPGNAAWQFTDVTTQPPLSAGHGDGGDGPRPSTIELLGLTEHIEGGYYRQLWESDGTFRTDRGIRTLANTILYLLDARSPIGRLHLNASDITHFSHGDSVVDYLLVAPDGTVHERRLGMDVDSGQTPTLTVPGGWWKASRLPEGAREALISEIAAPGFVYQDQRLAHVRDVPELFPRQADRVLPYAFG